MACTFVTGYGFTWITWYTWATLKVRALFCVVAYCSCVMWACLWETHSSDAVCSTFLGRYILLLITMDRDVLWVVLPFVESDLVLWLHLCCTRCAATSYLAPDVTVPVNSDVGSALINHPETFTVIVVPPSPPHPPMRPQPSQMGAQLYEPFTPPSLQHAARTRPVSSLSLPI